MRAPVWLLLPLLVLVGCATTSVASVPQKDCDAGSASACEDWGDSLLGRGEAGRAEMAYGQACEGGIATSCLHQGRLMMDRGELDAAERPLRRAYLEEFPEAYDALADLYQARADTRGDPGSQRIARGLRFEAPAIDKPAVEVISRFQADARGVGGWEWLVNVQPMALLSRRLSLGMHASFASGELDGFIGYQHFATPWAVPFARLLLGETLGGPGERAFNYGGELGVKLCLGPIGHLELAAGSSRANPLHVSVGLGFNAVFLLLAAR